MLLSSFLRNRQIRYIMFLTGTPTSSCLPPSSQRLEIQVVQNSCEKYPTFCLLAEAVILSLLPGGPELPSCSYQEMWFHGKFIYFSYGELEKAHFSFSRLCPLQGSLKSSVLLAVSPSSGYHTEQLNFRVYLNIFFSYCLHFKILRYGSWSSGRKHGRILLWMGEH